MKRNKQTTKNRSNKLEKTNVVLTNEWIFQKVLKTMMVFYWTNGILEQIYEKTIIIVLLNERFYWTIIKSENKWYW